MDKITLGKLRQACDLSPEVAREILTTIGGHYIFNGKKHKYQNDGDNFEGVIFEKQEPDPMQIDYPNQKSEYQIPIIVVNPHAQNEKSRPQPLTLNLRSSLSKTLHAKIKTVNGLQRLKTTPAKYVIGIKCRMIAK